uniref:vesicle-fusing ATPase n=1 Tax=Fibrocapsa japonica TaxID=94617 RepID=A0A7S2UTU6_9STRA|mmetsp:Transcript_13042/g.19245  ORF Transcript_13042/g.19245 Transcript_13042/m.19245 type:complete len:457 (+) Transcript_13042:34-1404(+)
MESKFIPEAIEIVTLAIKEDNAQNYEAALGLYKRALERFMVGLKYEKNESSKQIITEKVQGYMDRAEKLKEIIAAGGAAAPPAAESKGSSASATASRKDEKKGGGGGEDDEQKRLRGALGSAIVSEKPNISWDDVAGLEQAKEALKEAVILPVTFPQLFTGRRKPWTGILLYGPPGTGKSYLAKAVATEAKSTFFAVSSSDLVSKWQGESEKLVRNLFEMGRNEGHAIVFIDEVDSLCGSRSEGENDSARRIKTEFLVQMQGVKNAADGGRVLVLGATNVPWELDAAIRRRFEKRIYIPLPEAGARERMFKIHVGDTPHDITDEEFHKLGQDTDGFSGSDISVLVREALYEPVRRCQTAKHWLRTGEGKLTPSPTFPSCAYCQPVLSTDDPKAEYPPCTSCGAIRTTLYEIPPDQLAEPILSFPDFEKALHNTRPSVAPEELDEFVKWTEEFGQEG